MSRCPRLKVWPAIAPSRTERLAVLGPTAWPTVPLGLPLELFGATDSREQIQLDYLPVGQAGNLLGTEAPRFLRDGFVPELDGVAVVSGVGAGGVGFGLGVGLGFGFVPNCFPICSATPMIFVRCSGVTSFRSLSSSARKLGIT